MAFSPPSVTQAAPSGPRITPCGAEPLPSGIWRTAPVAGSSLPSVPLRCPVYQTVPSGAGATSCGPEPAGTAYSCIVGCAAGAAVGLALGPAVRPAAGVVIAALTGGVVVATMDAVAVGKAVGKGVAAGLVSTRGLVAVGTASRIVGVALP